MARSVLGFLLVATLVFAAARSFRLAIAEFAFSAAGHDAATLAASVEPGRALYRVQLAEFEDRAGTDSRPLWREAASLAPDDDAVWIRLGLLEESAGRFGDAETALLEAARRSRKFPPRWTLANFYYRRQDPDPFWRWMREALEISYGDRTPLFRLCWDMTPDPGVIFDRAISPTRPVQLAWLRFLLGRGESVEAARLARTLSETATEPEASLFLGVTDTLLGGDMYAEALAVWNSLCLRGVIPASIIDPKQDAVITNPDFSRPTLARGFDWRIQNVDGVFVTEAPGSWTVSLTGTQPERSNILSQFVPLVPGLRYRFSAEYRFRPSTARGLPASGLRWMVRAAGGRLLGESPALAQGELAAAEFDFSVPDDVSGARVVLEYERPAGSVRAEGSLLLERVRLAII